ncbi:hypothetical protein IJT17_04615 [bacterium]|nr:hypothetical protein [bacterium]
MAILLALALPYTAIGKPKLKVKHSDPEAVEAVQAIYNTVFTLREFKADVSLVIQNEEFLKGFFDTAEGEGVSTVGIKGLLHYTDQTGCNLLLRKNATEYNCFELGTTTSYSGIRTLKRKKNSNIVKIINAEGTPSSSPEASATPEASPSPSPSPSPSASPIGDFANPFTLAGKAGLDSFMALLTPTRTTAPRDFPLSYVLPYTINSRLHGNVFIMVNPKAFVFTTKCAEIEAINPRSSYRTKLWIDTEHKRLLQVMRISDEEHVKITASYVGAYQPDPKTGFAPYQRVEVSVNGYPIYFAELTDPQINPEKPVVEEETTESGTNTRYRSSNFVTSEIVPFLSEQKVKLVVFLSIILAVLGMRYAMFAASRQEFSDELMVIDEPRGRFSETLSKLGYKIIPFSIQALSDERHLLGKGATKDTTNRPHAIIVAPLSFNEVARHSFLIRAYVEEGGRVLVMRHPKKMEASFPYSAEMMPIPNVGITVESDANVLTALKEEDIHRLVSTYVTNEAYLKIDGKSFYKSLITLTNKQTDLKATTVGAVRRRKGEYMVCQMQITSQHLASDANLQLLFNDIIRYLLGLDPLPYDREDLER